MIYYINTNKYQDFSFYWKIISLSRAVKILFLSFTREDIGVAMVINMISQLQEGFPLRSAAGSSEISFTKWLRGAKTVQSPSRWAAKFSHQYFFRAWRTSRKIFCDRHFAIGYHFNWTVLLFRKSILKKSCLLCRNFISIYKINRTLHGRMGIRIFSPLTGEKCFQHGKIKFVSPRSHVISSVSC